MIWIMKKIVNNLILVVAMMLFAVNAFAQNSTPKERLSREQLAEKQAQHIATDLSLDDKVTAKFVDTYTQCQKEVWALGPRPRFHKNDSDAQIEQNIKKRFEMSEKILSIRQKYYKKYSQFLTQKQIQRVYEIEQKMMNRFSQHGPKGGQKMRRR